MKVLVIGGSGRIGQRIMEVLAVSGHEPIDFDILPPKKKFGFIKGTITDRNQVQSATKNVDAVIHLAAYPTETSIPNYPEGWAINCTGTFNVFEAAVNNNVTRILYASSICASGILTCCSPHQFIEYFPVDEKHPARPENLYGISKLISEELANMYALRSETTFVGLRIATVWFDQPEGGLAASTKQLIEKYVLDPSAIVNMKQECTPLNINAAKDLAWQYVALSDVALAFKLALERGTIGSRVYNIGAADTCSDWESLKLAKTFYPHVRIRNAPQFKRYPKKALWSISKAQKELNYKPEFNWQRILQELKR